MMSSYREEDLAATLAELRPTPRPEFAAELDARAAAGFPRPERGGDSSLSRALARLRATPPRRLLLPAGGVAVAAVAVATALIATTQEGGGRQVLSESGGVTRSSTAQPPPAVRPEIRESAVETAPTHASAGANQAGASESEVQYSQEAPAVSKQSATAERETGPYASHHNGRDVERGASMTLASQPSEVRSDARQVFEAVHAADGIVLHSAIRDGSGGNAGATFDLLIPTARLGDAMAAFSGIAEVRARHESSADITAPTVSAQEHLQDAAARVKSLLAQLASADTEAQRAEAEYELNAARGRKAALRSQLAGLQRRANLAHVSLRIETGAAGEEGGGGGWGVGDGFDDAGRILAIAAGVAIIGLAALAPFAILALLAWLGRGAYVRRARVRAIARV
jgi:hypothetical protein